MDKEEQIKEIEIPKEIQKLREKLLDERRLYFHAGNFKSFLESFNDEYKDRAEEKKFMDEPLHPIFGFILSIRDCNPDKYFYIYQTHEKQFGILTEEKHKRWIEANKDFELRSKIGTKVEWYKILKRSYFFKDLFDEKTGKYNGISLNGVISEIGLRKFADHLKTYIRITVKPVGDGYSLDNWVKAYMLTLDQGMSSCYYNCTSCLSRHGKEAQKRFNKYHEAISCEGKTLQIWGAYIDDKILVARFKMWVTDTGFLCDRVYGRQEYTDIVLREISKIPKTQHFRTQTARDNLFSQLSYRIPGHRFKDAYKPYMDNMAYYRVEGPDVIIAHKKQRSSSENWNIAQSQYANEIAIYFCEACGNPMIDNQKMCPTCEKTYTKGYKFEDTDGPVKRRMQITMKKQDAFYSPEGLITDKLEMLFDLKDEVSSLKQETKDYLERQISILTGKSVQEPLFAKTALELPKTGDEEITY